MKDFLKKVGGFMLDSALESGFKKHAIDRPFYCNGVEFSDVRNELEKRISKKSLIIKAETRDGWQEVGLVRSLSESKITFSPHQRHNFAVEQVEITRNHLNKIVARAKGRWIDSGISIS